MKRGHLPPHLLIYPNNPHSPLVMPSPPNGTPITRTPSRISHTTQAPLIPVALYMDAAAIPALARRDTGVVLGEHVVAAAGGVDFVNETHGDADMGLAVR